MQHGLKIWVFSKLNQCHSFEDAKQNHIPILDWYLSGSSVKGWTDRLATRWHRSNNNQTRYLSGLVKNWLIETMGIINGSCMACLQPVIVQRCQFRVDSNRPFFDRGRRGQYFLSDDPWTVWLGCSNQQHHLPEGAWTVVVLDTLHQPQGLWGGWHKVLHPRRASSWASTGTYISPLTPLFQNGPGTIWNFKNPKSPFSGFRLSFFEFSRLRHNRFADFFNTKLSWSWKYCYRLWLVATSVSKCQIVAFLVKKLGDYER